MLRSWWMSIVLVGWAFGGMARAEDNEVKFADCPEAVRKTIQAEAPGVKVEEMTRTKGEEGEVTFAAEVTIGGKEYEIVVMEDGTLSEFNLEVGGDEEVGFDLCPAAVQATFKAEAFGLTIKTVARDLKYGVAVYESVVDHKGKAYQVVVAEDGTLVEKVLVIDEEDLELAACPAAVQAALRKHAKGGAIDGVSRSAGLGKPTFEAEVEIKGKVYLVEVDEAGLLISKTLQAAQE